jgi:4a-hydroxytetrahydrobiopterin dehydratase
VKELQFNSFGEVVAFINKILPLAEGLNHHPDLLIHSYNKLKITLFTHSEGEVTNKDYKLAELIDSI